MEELVLKSAQTDIYATVQTFTQVTTALVPVNQHWHQQRVIIHINDIKLKTLIVLLNEVSKVSKFYILKSYNLKKILSFSIEIEIHVLIRSFSFNTNFL